MLSSLYLFKHVLNVKYCNSPNLMWEKGLWCLKTLLRAQFNSSGNAIKFVILFERTKIITRRVSRGENEKPKWKRESFFSVCYQLLVVVATSTAFVCTFSLFYDKSECASDRNYRANIFNGSEHNFWILTYWNAWIDNFSYCSLKVSIFNDFTQTHAKVWGLTFMMWTKTLSSLFHRIGIYQLH